MSYLKSYLFVLVPVFLALCGYSMTVYNGYVWDDIWLFVNNADIRGGDFFSAVTKQILPGSSYFRPFVMASYFVEFKVFGTSPIVSHSINLLFHCLNTVLVFLCSWRLAGWRSDDGCAIGLVSACLYAVHPALVESVAWSAGRFDVLFTFFALIFLLLSLSEDRRSVLFSGFVFFLAALCKESAVVLPFVSMVLCFFVVGRDVLSFDSIKKRYFVVFAFGVFYVLLRWLIVPGFVSFGESISNGSGGNSVFVFGLTCFLYLKMAFVPFFGMGPQHLVPDVFVFVDLIKALFGFGVLAMAIYFSIFRRNKLAVLFVLGFVALLPVLNLLPIRIGGNLGHERFLTFPLFFWCLFLSFSLLRSELSRYGAIAFKFLTAGFCILCLAVTYTMVPMWRDNLSLWSWSYSANSDSPSVYFNLVSAALWRGDLAKADELLRPYRGMKNNPLAVLEGAYQVKHGAYEAGFEILSSEFDNSKWPHYALHSAGIDLSKAKLTGNAGFGMNWIVSYAFAEMAIAARGLGRYDVALEKAKVSAFYSEGYIPAMREMAFAYYALGDFVRANELFETLLSQSTAESRREDLYLRKVVMNRLCADGLKRACEPI